MNPRDQWPQRERSRSDEMAAVLYALKILDAHVGRRSVFSCVPTEPPLLGLRPEREHAVLLAC